MQFSKTNKLIYSKMESQKQPETSFLNPNSTQAEYVKYTINVKFDFFFQLFYNVSDYINFEDIGDLEKFGFKFKLASSKEGYHIVRIGDEVDYTTGNFVRKNTILAFLKIPQIEGKECILKTTLEEDNVKQISYTQRLSLYPSTTTNHVVVIHKLYNLVIEKPNTKHNLQSEKEKIEFFSKTVYPFLDVLFKKEKYMIHTETAIINTCIERLTELCRDLHKLQKVAPLLCDKVVKLSKEEEINIIKDKENKEEYKNCLLDKEKFKLIWNDGRKTILSYYLKPEEETNLEDAFNEVAYSTIDENSLRPQQIIFFQIYEIDKKCLLKFTHRFNEKISDLSYQFFHDIKQAILLQIKEHFENETNDNNEIN